jgi:hypothetical protein
MSDRVNEKQLIQLLAANTELLLAGGKPAETDIAALEHESAGSWEVIERLARIIPQEMPEVELRNRIRAKLSAQWDVTGPGAKPRKRFLRFLNINSGMTLAWGTIAIAVIVMAVLLLGPTVIQIQSATANFQTGALIAGIVILAIIAIFLWWLKRKP